MSFLNWLRALFSPAEPDPAESVEALLLAAQADEGLRHQLLYLVGLPPTERAAVLHRAVQKMDSHDGGDSMRDIFILLNNPQLAEGIAKTLRNL